MILLISVAGCGGNGSSGDKGGNNDQVNGSDSTAPTIPQSLTATTSSSTQIDLSWDASADDVGVTGYNIYRCAGSCTPTTFLTTSTTNSYSDTGLAADTPYTYTVSAYDAAGNESGESDGVSGTTLASAVGDVYYVSPSGTASWTQCTDINTPCSFSTANVNAIAGDTVNFRAGTYSGTKLEPSNSGTAQNKITFQAYNGETVTINNVQSDDGALHLNGVDYTVIDGIIFDNNWRMAHIEGGSNYNEIKNCTFSNSVTGHKGGFYLYTLYATVQTANTHNWIHDNVMHNAGYITETCNDEGALIDIGTDAAYDDDLSGYNTFEDNILYYGSHHALSAKTKYNVIRNNFIHNEAGFPASSACEAALSVGPSGEYGNRVLAIYDDQDTGTPDTYVLIENNRLGEAGFPSDGNGAFNLVIGGGRVIVRYNTLYNSPDTNLYFRSSGMTGDDNRVYNNTFYRSGYNSSSRTSNGWTRRGVWVQANAEDNVMINNIIYDNINNNELYVDPTVVNFTNTNNWITSTGDPKFVDTDLSDSTSSTTPNLSLQSGSGAIDAGTYLTQANGSGGNSTTLVVDDALFFQDGTWGSSLSNIQADYIAIGTVSNTVQISSIDYSTNTITLASPITWSDNTSIWLYKDSSGNIVLRGSAPDIGAYEYEN